jgi:tetratricopeptide (TPR) repeat protein
LKKKLKNTTIFLLFICALFFGCKKESAKIFSTNKHIDSLLITVNKTIDNNTKLIIADKIFKKMEGGDLDSISRIRYMNLARIYLSINDLKYTKICELLISNPAESINHNEISFLNYILGNYYYKIANYEKSFLHLSKAEKSFAVLNNRYYLCYVMSTKADILTFKNDYSGAEILSIKSLKIAKELKKEDLIYSCYLTLGSSLAGLNNYDKAIGYYNKAIETSYKLKNSPEYPELRVMPYNYIASVYKKEKNYIKTLKIVQQALKFDNFKKNNSEIYCYLTNNLGYSKFKLGDKSSLNQFQETLKIGDSIKSIPIQITSKTYLGEYYLTEKDTVKANFYLKEAQSQAHKNNIFEDELKILQLLALSNPVKEGFYSNRYIQLNDSLQNIERTTRDKFARIEFETDEINSQKEVITKEKDNLQYQLYLIIGIAILSLMLLVLWFQNESQKARTRELLLEQEHQKDKEEIYQLMLNQQQKIDEGKQFQKICTMA